MGESKTELPPALYFNVMRVSHTPREFFFELGQLADPEAGTATLVARVVTSPAHAKAMLQALGANIRKYEERYGTIRCEEGERAEVGL